MLRLPAPSVATLILTTVLLAWTLPVKSQVAVVFPTNTVEYERLYGHEPTQSQLEEVSRLRSRYSGTVTEIRSLNDFQALLQSDNRLVFLVGHNDLGEFKFTSGESQSLQRLSEMVENSNKLGVYLTCRGACSVDAPATRKNTTLSEALLLATALNSRFFYVNNPSNMKPLDLPQRVDPVPPGSRASLVFPQQRFFAGTMVAARRPGRCRHLLRATGTSPADSG